MLAPLSDVAWLPLTAVLAAAFAATITDIRSFKIYNLLTVPLLLSGLAFNVWQNGYDGFQGSLAGVAVGFAVLVIPYLGGAIAAGDVKLLMGVGAWLGAFPTALIALAGCLLTGLCAAAILVQRGGMSAVWWNTQLNMLRIKTVARHLFTDQSESSVREIVADPSRRRELIPFSVMLLAGMLALLVLTLIVGRS